MEDVVSWICRAREALELSPAHFEHARISAETIAARKNGR